MFFVNADVAELADALDSKSSARKGVWVRLPPSAFCAFGAKSYFNFARISCSPAYRLSDRNTMPMIIVGRKTPIMDRDIFMTASLSFIF